MKSFRLCSWLVCLAALVLPSLVASAKGPCDKVVISGHTLNNSVEVTDHTVLAELDFSALMDFDRPAPPPSTLQNYALTCYHSDGSGNLRPGFTMRYYPDPSGGAGIFYNAYTLQGSWFYATSEGKNTMGRLLNEGSVQSFGFMLGNNSTSYMALLTVWATVLSLLTARRRFLLGRTKRQW